VTVQWIKCVGNVWCRLLDVDLSGIGDVAGVYAIWDGRGQWIRVGQGVIRDRLSAHRGDPAILRFRDNILYVSWASVAAGQRDGVEAYLAQQCNPLVGERFPNRMPIPVNLPQ